MVAKALFPMNPTMEESVLVSVLRVHGNGALQLVAYKYLLAACHWLQL